MVVSRTSTTVIVVPEAVVSRTSTTVIVVPEAMVPEALEGTIINELNEALAA